MNNLLTNQTSKIPCRICGQLFHYINNTHLFFKHHTNLETYKRLFPDAPLKSDEYLSKYRHHSQIMKVRYYEGVVNPPVPTEEQRLMLSQRMKTNNPMKIKSIAKKVSKAKKGVSNEEWLRRRLEKEQELEEIKANREKARIGMAFGR